MRIGVRGHDYGKLTPEMLAKRLKADGYQAVHLAPYKALELEGDFLEEKNILRVRDAFDAEGIQIAVLGCYIDPGTLDDKAYASSVEKFKAYVKVAKKLGAVCVGTETSICPTDDDMRREKQYARVLDFARQMTALAQTEGTLVAIEPVYRHTINTPTMMKRLLDEVQSPKLKVIFDPVNLLYEGNVPVQEKVWESAFECYQNSVIAVHIKDGVYHGNEYSRCALGQGVARFELIAQWLKTNGGDMTLLREEAVPVRAQEEIAYIKSIFM